MVLMQMTSMQNRTQIKVQAQRKGERSPGGKVVVTMITVKEMNIMKKKMRLKKPKSK